MVQVVQRASGLGRLLIGLRLAMDAKQGLRPLNSDRKWKMSEMRAALLKCLNYIENTESELGITLPCGDAARLALSRAYWAEDRYKSALQEIRLSHVPDQPASSAADGVSWVMQHVGRIRKIAADAIDRGL